MKHDGFISQTRKQMGSDLRQFIRNNKAMPLRYFIVLLIILCSTTALYVQSLLRCKELEKSFIYGLSKMLVIEAYFEHNHVDKVSDVVDEAVAQSLLMAATEDVNPSVMKVLIDYKTDNDVDVLNLTETEKQIVKDYLNYIKTLSSDGIITVD